MDARARSSQTARSQKVARTPQAATASLRPKASRRRSSSPNEARSSKAVAPVRSAKPSARSSSRPSRGLERRIFAGKQKRAGLVRPRSSARRYGPLDVLPTPLLGNEQQSRFRAREDLIDAAPARQMRLVGWAPRVNSEFCAARGRRRGGRSRSSPARSPVSAPSQAGAKRAPDSTRSKNSGSNSCRSTTCFLVPNQRYTEFGDTSAASAICSIVTSSNPRLSNRSSATS